MNYGGEAAEQVVRMSLAGMEVAVKITGSGAKKSCRFAGRRIERGTENTKESQTDKYAQIRQGIDDFTMPAKDMKIFAAEAKRYGVLYSVIKDRQAKTKSNREHHNQSGGCA